jgi:glycosyltransferase involved in cell wall biosynthesis
MRYSVIIPAYNEAAVIVSTVRLLSDELAKTFSDNWEIIVVDNASTDGTGQKVEALHMRGVSVLALAEKGKGIAVRAGFTKAKGDIVGFVDADLSVEPKDVVDALSALEKNSDDVIIGSRTHAESRLPSREWWRTGSSFVFNLLTKMIVGVRMSDTQCPLKFMKARGVAIMLSTKEPTWFFDIEFAALIERLRVPHLVVPVSWNEHRYQERKSKLSMTRDGIASIAAMWRIRKRLPNILAILTSRAAQ